MFRQDLQDYQDKAAFGRKANRRKATRESHQSRKSCLIEKYSIESIQHISAKINKIVRIKRPSAVPQAKKSS